MRKLWIMLFAMMIFLAGCSLEQPVGVTIGRALVGDEDFIVTHEGQISLSDELEILSKVSGNVMEKYFENGTDVKEGQLLYKTDGMGPYADLLQARVELTKAMTDLAKAISELQQVERNSSEQEVADKQAEIAALQTKANELQTKVEAMEADAEVGMVYAPKSGRIGADSVELGEEVIENETILATIGNINSLTVRFEVSDIEKNILMNSKPKVTLKFMDGTLYPQEGMLKISDSKSIVEADFDNSEGLLLIGMKVKIELSCLNLPDFLFVSEKAIQQRNGETFVFLDEDEKAVLKKVSLGDKLGNYYIVKDGLKPCDAIIVDGFDNLREGTPLKINSAVECQ